MKPKAQTTVPPEKIVESMVDVMNQLAETLMDEVKLLKKPNVKEMQELLNKKNKLITQYQNGVNVIMTQPGLVKKASRELRDQLKTTGIKFAEATEYNAKALIGAVQGTKRVIDHVLKHVRQEALPQLGYKDPRKARLALGTYSPTCQPVAVNRTA